MHKISVSGVTPTSHNNIIMADETKTEGFGALLGLVKTRCGNTQDSLWDFHDTSEANNTKKSLTNRRQRRRSHKQSGERVVQTSCAGLDATWKYEDSDGDTYFSALEDN